MLWLQGEAVFETHSFRDAEPHSVISHNDKKNDEMSPKKREQTVNISTTTHDPCLPRTAKQDSDVC